MNYAVIFFSGLSCRFHVVGNSVADVRKSAISQIQCNIYILCIVHIKNIVKLKLLFWNRSRHLQWYLIWYADTVGGITFFKPKDNLSHDVYAVIFWIFIFTWCYFVYISYLYGRYYKIMLVLIYIILITKY